MNIASTQFTLKNRSFEIYLSGCDGLCGTSCHNYELRDFNIGIPYQQKIFDIIEKIKDFDLLIDNIWILGGEPLLQNHDELTNLLCDLKTTNKKIWLWTRFNLDEVPLNIKDKCDYIKTGMYIPKLKTEENIQYGIKIATLNQTINKITK